MQLKLLKMARCDSFGHTNVNSALAAVCGAEHAKEKHGDHIFPSCHNLVNS